MYPSKQLVQICEYAPISHVLHPSPHDKHSDPLRIDPLGHEVQISGAYSHVKQFGEQIELHELMLSNK